MLTQDRGIMYGYLAGLLKNESFGKVLGYIENDHKGTVDEQRRLALTEAPTFSEGKRAELLCGKFRELGLADVHIDDAGNATGLLKGAAGGGLLLVEAHLDTVFPAGTVKGVTNNGDRIEVPGICDNCRGLAAMLGIIRAIKASGIRLAHDVLFAATTGEEGLGDLKGMKELFKPEKSGFYASISIDGCGGHFVFDGTGSRRYSVVFETTGGHSWMDFGSPSAVHSLGRAVAKITSFSVPEEPKTTFNVGTVGGGTSVNSIAQRAEMLVDMRSVSSEELRKLEASFKQAVFEACKEEMDKSRNKHEVRSSFRKVGDRPGGLQDGTNGMRLLAELSGDLLGMGFEDSGPSSTNANIPVSRGVPCLCMGGGGSGGGIHTVEEWFNPDDGWRQVQRAALIIAALAEVSE